MSGVMPNQWDELAESLEAFGIGRNEASARYLRRSFFQVKDLWSKQHNAILAMGKIRLVMFGEAPLYGKKESYFYNAAAGATEFFTYKDAEAIVGPLLYSSRVQKNGTRPRKEEMLKSLAKAGVLVVDLMPFALNQFDTVVTYSSIRKESSYLNIFDKCWDPYLLPMLKLVLEHTTPETKFVFRYQVLRNLFERRLIDELGKLGRAVDTIPSIHESRSVNRSELLRIWISSAQHV